MGHSIIEQFVAQFIIIFKKGHKYGTYKEGSVGEAGRWTRHW